VVSQAGFAKIVGMNSNPWKQHPDNYRAQAVQAVLTALRAGESVSVIGLSGMGKSNLLGFLANRKMGGSDKQILGILVDCNRLIDYSASGLFEFMLSGFEQSSGNRLSASAQPSSDAYINLENAVSLSDAPAFSFLFDGLDPAAAYLDHLFFNRLRALRDANKYRLSYLTATRQPLRGLSGWENVREIDDLFSSNQVWLQPLDEPDARWSIQRLVERHDSAFSENENLEILRLSGSHPGLLKAIALGWLSKPEANPQDWLKLPAVQRE
jgi:hypothetical protein